MKVQRRLANPNQDKINVKPAVLTIYSNMVKNTAETHDLISAVIRVVNNIWWWIIRFAIYLI